MLPRTFVGLQRDPTTDAPNVLVLGLSIAEVNPTARRFLQLNQLMLRDLDEVLPSTPFLAFVVVFLGEQERDRRAVLVVPEADDHTLIYTAGVVDGMPPHVLQQIIDAARQPEIEQE